MRIPDRSNSSLVQNKKRHLHPKDALDYSPAPKSSMKNLNKKFVRLALCTHATAATRKLLKTRTTISKRNCEPERPSLAIFFGEPS